MLCKIGQFSIHVEQDVLKCLGHLTDSCLEISVQRQNSSKLEGEHFQFPRARGKQAGAIKIDMTPQTTGSCALVVYFSDFFITQLLHELYSVTYSRFTGLTTE